MDDLFPLHAFRDHVAADTSVKSRVPSAKSISVETQFDAQTADNLSSAILSATKNAAQSYTYTLDGALSLSGLALAMPLIVLSYGSLQGYSTKITSLKINRGTGQTVVTSRGVA